MPVLLAKLNIEIDIVENIKFFMPLENISKVEWSMGSLHCQVVLPSTTLFIKGELIAEIEFINNGVNNIIHSLKVPIPWSKTTTIHWLTFLIYLIVIKMNLCSNLNMTVMKFPL